MSGSQKIRGVLFYISVTVFIVGLPFILTYTMGLQFDSKTLKFTRTGIISLKTDPPGASVYLDEKLLSEKTPSSINELLPGTYRIKLTLEGFYPYTSDVEVTASKVTRMEKIILFPLRVDVKKLNQESISSFWLDEAKNLVYYVDFGDSTVYRSDTDGQHFEPVAQLKPLKNVAKKFALSPDKERLLYYNAREIGVVNLTQQDGHGTAYTGYTMVYPGDDIREIVWYSDSYHLIVIGERQIAMLETKPDTVAVVLTTLNKRNSAVSYDARNEILYFSDTHKAEDGKTYDNVYRLELKTKLYPFKDFLKLKSYD